MSVLHAECHFAHVDYDYPVLHSGFHYLIGISLSSLNLLPDVLNVKNKSPLKGLLLLFVASLYKMCTVGHMPQNHSGMCWQTETMSVQDLLNENQKGAGEPVSHGHQGMTVAKFFFGVNSYTQIFDRVEVGAANPCVVQESAVLFIPCLIPRCT